MKITDPVLHNIRKEAILQHARHLFATKGFAETTVDDVAHACNMQKASLYHYFESKDQLLQELMHLASTRWAERVKTYETGKDLPDTLRIIGTTFLKDLDDPARRETFKIIHFESYKNPSILRVLKESPAYNRRGFYGAFARHLEGRLPENVITVYITQFMGALIHYAGVSKLRAENLVGELCDDAAYVEQLVRIFVAGAETLLRNQAVGQ